MNRYKKYVAALILSGITFASVDLMVMAKPIEESNNIEIVDIGSELSSLLIEEGSGDLIDGLVEEDQAIHSKMISNDKGSILHSGTWGELTWELDDEGTLTISGEGEMADFSSGGSAWLQYSGLIQSVIVEGTVNNIGANAFWTCNNLEEVTIQSGVTSIGSYVFDGCENLKKIRLPSSLTSIEEMAFYGCNGIKTAGPKGENYDVELGWTDTIPENGLRFPSLEEVTIPNGVSSIGNSTFYGCENLKTINLPSSLKTIGDSAFSGCKGLEEISLPEGVISIGYFAFYECEKLKKLNLPSSLTSIGSSAFLGCNGIKTAGPKGGNYDVELGWIDTIPENGLPFPALEEVTIPNGVTSIGGQAFCGCENLKRINQPSSLTSIGDSAFSGCKGLEEISLPEGVVSIGRDAFHGCENLKRIKLPSSLTSIGSSAFLGCNGIKTAGPIGGGYDVEFGWTEVIPENGLRFPALEEVTIPNGVSSIGNNTFNGCENLKRINLPSSLTKIGDSAFSGCKGLQEISLPEGVTNVGSAAFYGCENLKKIKLPSSLIRINDSTFSGCNGIKTAGPIGGGYDVEFGWTDTISENGLRFPSLEEVIIPEGVTSIGANAFNGCENLNKIELPSSLTSIEHSGFYGCTSLEKIILPEGLKSLGSSVFSNCDNLSKIVLPSSLSSVDWMAFGVLDNCNKVKTAGPIGGGYDAEFGWTESIPDNGLNFPALEEITFPDDIKNIGAVWFCKNLRHIVIPEGVTHVGGFIECERIKTVGPIGGNYDAEYEWTESIPAFGLSFSNMESVTIAEGITSIGDRAFGDGLNLKRVIFPESLTDINPNAINNITCLKTAGPVGGDYDVQFGWKESIPEYGLYFSSLEEIYIPDGIKSIGPYAVCGYEYKLKKLVIPESLVYIHKDAFPKNECGIKTAGPIGGNYDLQFGWKESIPGNGLSFKSLEEITFPEGMKNLGSSSLKDCVNLKRIVLPKSLTFIGHNNFAGCSEIKTAGPIGGNYDVQFGWDEVIPANGLSFPNLEEVMLPSGITTIGSNAFSGCASLTGIDIPNGVDNIGSGTFSGCTNLKRIDLPDKLTTINYDTFNGCKELESIDIPKSVSSIGNYAFSGCSKLKSITLPEQLTSIGHNAFSNCINLESIVFPEGLSSIGYRVFEGCNGLKTAGPIGGDYNIQFGWTESIPDRAFSGIGLEEITIPKTVNAIGDSAFSGCEELKEITLPEGITSIGDSTFSRCMKLSSLIIPEGVTNIGEYAFSGCNGLLSITIPDSVKVIGESAFSRCSSLSEIYIPAGVESIGDWAFEDCTGLTGIQISQGVTKIGNGAFWGCNKLKTVSIPDSVSWLGGSAFGDCSSLEQVELPKKMSYLGTAFYECSSLKTITIPEGISALSGDEEAGFFYGCTNLNSVYIPFTVTRIEYYAFSGCENLEHIYYGSTKKRWEEISIKEGNERLNDVQIHYSEYIAKGNCNDQVTWILDESGVLTISGEGELPDFDKLGAPWRPVKEYVKKIVIDDGITIIGAWSFYECSEMTEVHVPLTVDEISSSAFNSCDGITDVYYAGTAEKWKSLSRNCSGCLRAATLHCSIEIFFEANGGEVKEKSKAITVGEAYGNLPTPEDRVGYLFLGWFLSADGNDKVIADTIVSIEKSHTLYAHWDAVKVMVTFDPNGGSVDPSTMELLYDSPYGSLPMPVFSGYVFDGWFTAKDGGNKVNQDSIVDQENDLVLYAHWSPIEFVVTFETFDSIKLETTISVAYDQPYGELPIPDKRLGFSFKGWFSEPDGGDEVTANTIVKKLQDHTLYAHWVVNEWTITFDAKGGLCETETIKVTYGQPYGELPTPSYGGHPFMGWYDKPEEGNHITADTIVSIDDNHTLYAGWGLIEIESIMLPYSELSMYVGKTQIIMAKVLPVNAASDEDIEWESSDESVAKVSGGAITAISPGRAIITASSFDGKVSASMTLVVESSDIITDDDIDVEDFDAPEGLWISGLNSSYTYTGSAVIPNIRVYFGNTLLKENVEYTISFTNNVNAGMASVVITGKENYSGKIYKSFEIVPLSLGDEDVIIPSKVATGKELKPNVKVVHEGKSLVANKDYVVWCPSISQVGIYEVKVSGIGNYKGEVKTNFVVKSGSSINIKKASVVGIKKSYSLSEIKALQSNTSKIVVTIDNEILDSKEYVLRFEKCDRVGKGAVVVMPTDSSSYVGEKRVAVNVTGVKLGSVILGSNSLVYSGKAQKPVINVYSGKNGQGNKIPQTAYEITYSSSATNVGTVTVTVTGKTDQGYTGKVTAKYKITPLSVSDSKVKVSMPEKISYAKGGATPKPLVTYSKDGNIWTLREGTDYTISYTNNKSVNGKKKPSYTLKGIGNYSGTIRNTFEISKTEISSLAISCADVAYNSKKSGNYYFSKPMIYDANGKLLKEKTDYKVNYYNLETGEALNKKSVLSAGTEVKAEIKATEKNYTGTVEIVYSVASSVKDISKAKVSKLANQAYTGKTIEIANPLITFVTGSGNNKMESVLTKGTDYIITGYYNNIKKGTASFRIEGRGEYCGAKLISFKIVAADAQKAWKGAYDEGEIIGIAPTSVKLDNQTVSVGSVVKLQPVFAPEKCDIPSCTWKSSNTKILTVDRNGNIVAKAKGTVRVTVTVISNKKLTTSATTTIK